MEILKEKNLKLNFPFIVTSYSKKNILDKIVNKSNLKVDLKKRSERIVKHIYNISFFGDILSFRLKKNFKNKKSLVALVNAIKKIL